MAALGAKVREVNAVSLVRMHCEVYERRGVACRFPWRSGGEVVVGNQETCTESSGSGKVYIHD